MWNELKIDGQTWLFNESVSYGDYGGGADIALANHLCIKNAHKNIPVIRHGDVEYTINGYYRLKWPEDDHLSFADQTVIQLGNNERDGITLCLNEELMADEIAALTNYPLLDDDSLYEARMIILNESWESYLKDDFRYEIEMIGDFDGWEMLAYNKLVENIDEISIYGTTLDISVHFIHSTIKEIHG